MTVWVAYQAVIHTHIMTNTKCRLDTVISPDDRHIFVRNMQRKEINIVTYFMVQSPSWEANWFAASQEIPRISRNPKVHYRTHKRPPPISILGQPNPVRIPTSHFLEIHPNIIHPSTPRSPHWSPSLRFPQQDILRKIVHQVGFIYMTVYVLMSSQQLFLSYTVL